MVSGTQTRNCVLDAAVIGRKIRRMALEIAEQNSGESEVVIAAVNGNGEVVAKSLVRELEKLAPFRILNVIIQLNKKEPLEVSLSSSASLQDKVILVVDDVANTGKTMLYALKPFLLQYPKKIQTLALVERSHKQFPVQTDFVGLSIATTLQEHIAVETNGEELTGAWLY